MTDPFGVTIDSERVGTVFKVLSGRVSEGEIDDVKRKSFLAISSSPDIRGMEAP